jgi:hypothetical protein
MKVGGSVMSKFFVVVLCVSLCVGLVPLLGVSYVNGDVESNGVPKDAVHIQTATQLAGIGGEGSVGKYYVLDNDIDLEDEWVPIEDFRGTFDGQGYSINNLYVLENSKRSVAGLFEQTTGEVSIKNVGVNIGFEGLTASASSGNADAGGLVGYSNDAVTVINSYVTGDITAYGFSVHVGGLVGVSRDVVVANSYATGDITVGASYGRAFVGGLIGWGIGVVNMEGSYASGDIVVASSSHSYQPACVGGLIGYSQSGIVIENSYTVGKIAITTITLQSSTQPACVGGLIGYSGYGNVTALNSYVMGDISATASGHDVCAGGLIGYIWVGDVNVTHSYVTCDVTASGQHAYVGGLIGYSSRGDVDVNSCYRLSSQKIIGDTINDAGSPLRNCKKITCKV